jgi:hypothetical protein
MLMLSLPNHERKKHPNSIKLIRLGRYRHGVGQLRRFGGPAEVSFTYLSVAYLSESRCSYPVGCRPPHCQLNVAVEPKNGVCKRLGRHTNKKAVANTKIYNGLCLQGAPSRTRTNDPLITSQKLYQLSYGGLIVVQK